MTWLSALWTAVVHYLVLPVTFIVTFIFTFIYTFLLRLLAPATHLASYVLQALLLPLRFLAKFETLYIYFGVAALIGIITGSVLHFASRVLIDLLDLRPAPEENGRTAASVRRARVKKLKEQWPDPSTVAQHNAARAEFLKEEYADFLDKGHGRSRDGHGLMSQTILEEDDDSDGF